MSRESAAIIAHLKLWLPAHLNAIRAGDPTSIVLDPKTWLAHEQFAGASAVNATNTPVVMCTVTAMTNARQFDTEPGETVWRLDYLCRVIVALHLPRTTAPRTGARSENPQRLYDSIDDMLAAVMDTLITQPKVSDQLVVSPRGMQAVRYTPTDPETIASYGEGEVAFTVTGTRVSIPQPHPSVDLVEIGVRPVNGDPVMVITADSYWDEGNWDAGAWDN